MKRVEAEKSVPCKPIECQEQRPRGKRNWYLAKEVRWLCCPEDNEKSLKALQQGMMCPSLGLGEVTVRVKP